MQIKKIDTDFQFTSKHEIAAIHYSFGRLQVTVRAVGQQNSVLVTFPEVAGFRVLDEGDLLDFWPHCPSDGGWLFQIVSGGWYEQERSRKGFIRESNAITEYFVTGEDDCINVLAWDLELSRP